MPLSRQKSSSAGKKLSPGSNRAPKVRPVVSSWLCIGVCRPYVFGIMADRTRRSPECGRDLLPAGAARQQHMQEQPGLERVEKSGADQAMAEQVLLGAGEAVGAGQHRPASGPVGE